MVNSKERDYAILVANKVLERVNADPDDDLAVLARQFLRAQDEIVHLRSLAGAVTQGPTAAETFAPLRHKTLDLQQAVTTAVALHWPSDGA